MKGRDGVCTEVAEERVSRLLTGGCLFWRPSKSRTRADGSDGRAAEGTCFLHILFCIELSILAVDRLLLPYFCFDFGGISVCITTHSITMQWMLKTRGKGDPNDVSSRTHVGGEKNSYEH